MKYSFEIFEHTVEVFRLVFYFGEFLRLEFYPVFVAVHTPPKIRI